jgi:hypothetical protein
VRYENEPTALFTVVAAEGGGLAVVATSGASDELAYDFDPSEDEWRYPWGKVQREDLVGGAPHNLDVAGGGGAKDPRYPYANLPTAARVIFADVGV